MHSFFVFLQKELVEQLRTKRGLILLCVFAFFGILSPVTARYVQEIMRMALGDMPFELPPPTWIDGWAQFFSNLTQMGALVIILLFMGSIAGEKQSGSAALTLTKNLSHTSFVLAKFISMALILAIPFFIAAGINYGYTHFLFGEAGDLANILVAAAAYCLGLMALLGVIVLSSALTKSLVPSAILAFGGFLLLTAIFPFLPVIQTVTPGALMNEALALAAGEEADLLPAILGALGFIALSLFGAIFALKKQEI